MEFTGRIIAVLELRSGVSQRTGKQWRSQEYVIETVEQYPRRMCFSVFDERIEQLNIKAGQMLTVSFDINAKEYQGRWYNQLQAWQVKPYGEAVQAAPPQQPQYAPQNAPQQAQALQHTNTPQQPQNNAQNAFENYNQTQQIPF